MWGQVILLVVVLALTAPLQAGEEGAEARQLLERMAHAIESASYDGTFVIQHERQLETMQILHYADAQGEYERLRSLNGVAREIVRDNGRVTCYLPDERLVKVDVAEDARLAPVEALRDTRRLALHYDFRVEGATRMAGESVRIVAIRPRDALRYGYRFWLHAIHALPLKSALIDESGMPVEQMMFTNFRMRDDLTRAALPVPMDTRGYRWQRGDADKGERVVDSIWYFPVLPAGYRLMQHNRHDAQAEHLMVGDGLATVSVYVEPARDGDKLLDGASRMGAVSAFGLRRNGYQVTAVGETPPETVRQIAGALRMRETTP